MNLLIDYDQQGVTFQADPLMPLSWVSYGLEAAALWFMGRAMWRLAFARSRGPSETVVFNVQPLEPGTRKPLIWSNYTTLETLVEETDFPFRLVEPWGISPTERGGLTVMEGFNLKRETTMGSLAYGLSDCVTDLYRRGAVNAQCQYSLARWQIKASVGLSRKGLGEFINPDVTNYDPGDHVAQLPWP